MAISFPCWSTKLESQHSRSPAPHTVGRPAAGGDLPQTTERRVPSHITTYQQRDTVGLPDCNVVLGGCSDERQPAAAGRAFTAEEDMDQMVMTTLPNACPSPTYRTASATSQRG